MDRIILSLELGISLIYDQCSVVTLLFLILFIVGH
jgi:hypothetical protein